jgi:hypothetical protein
VDLAAKSKLGIKDAQSKFFWKTTKNEPGQIAKSAATEQESLGHALEFVKSKVITIGEGIT